jgi:membrane protease YdiL (CAAX protease family)
MADQTAFAETCRVCGAPLDDKHLNAIQLCTSCAANDAYQVASGDQSMSAAEEAHGVSDDEPRQGPPDPDRPHWSAGAGIGVWISSVAAVIVIPLLAVGLWVLIQWMRGGPLPDFKVKEEVEQWVTSPNILFLQIISTIAAHAVTLAICWAVVTRLGSRPFRASVGWSLGGHRIWYWVAFSACLLLAIDLLSRLLLRFLPQTESPFEQMLKASQQVRIAVAVLAIFTAPLAEEIVYRGVLYSSLRKSIGLSATVPVVTVLFAGVHVFEYRGAWVSMSGLTLLSLVLTMVRAKTKSILPCIVIHTVNNAVASLSLLLNNGS